MANDVAVVSAGVMAGRLIAGPAPDYPPIAKAAGIHGLVALEAIISSAGAVESVKAVGGPPMLFESAMSAVRQWSYKPFLLNGRPVAVRTTIRVNFELDSNGSAAPAAADARQASDSAAPILSTPALDAARKKLDAAAAELDVFIAAQGPAPSRGFAPEVPPPSTAAAVRIPKNYALIFATDDYAQWPHLTNPIPDADAVGSTLASLYRFEVDELRNASSNQILLKLNEYLHRKFEPQDQLLIFFSGHGYFDSDLGQGFIVPADAPLVHDDPTHRGLLAYDEIMRYINRIPATHIVLIADACFAGTLDRRIADGAFRGDTSEVYARATLPEMLARKELKRTRRYFASGGKDFVPDGLPGHHSPFISAFLVTLNQAADRKGYLTLDDIQQGLNTVTPEPRWGDIGEESEPGADFLLLTPESVAKLNSAH